MGAASSTGFVPLQEMLFDNMRKDRLRLLVCGDDAPAGREMEKHAAALGHAVVTGGAGVENILVSAAAIEPDVVFIACTAPQGEGLEIARRLRQSCPVPLVLLAREVSDALLADTALVGGIWVLALPAESAAVADAIRVAQVRHRDLLEIRCLHERLQLTVRELLHRVKNDLAVITSLMHFQADTCSSAETAAAILEGADRVRVISALYDIIRSSAYQDILRLDHYLELLLSKATQGLSEEGTIAFDVAADCILLDGAGALSCGLIVHELVANAMKYAFADRATDRRITVAVRKSPAGEIEIRVGDNGAGLPATIDPARPTTFGFQLISFLVGQLKGTMEVARSGGTMITIRFKAPKLNRATPAGGNGIQNTDCR